MADEAGSQGQTTENLDEGQGLKGAPKLPTDTGNTPVAKTDDEEHGTPAQKSPAELAAEKAGKDKPADKEQETNDDDEPEADGWNGEYIELQDSAGQSVIDLLKEAGVGAKEANSYFAEAIQNNDLSKINWEALEERLGPAKANLARIGIEDYYNRVYSRNVETTQKAHEVVGGEKNWQKVAKWVKSVEAANPSRKAEFDEIRRGIDAGGKIAVLAVKELKSLYEGDPKNSGLGTSKVTEGTRKAEVAGGPLTRAEYLAAIKEVHERPGGAAGKQADIKALQARRRAGMEAGR